MNRHDKYLDARIRHVMNINKDAPQHMRDYLVDREHTREHEKWVYKVKKHLPELAQRVFALRGKMYSGCGFQYCLEAKLGQVICDLNGGGRHPRMDYIERMVERSVISCNVELLFKDIVRIEKELKGKIND